MNSIKHLHTLDMATKRAKHPSVPEHALPQSKYSDKSANELTKAIIAWIELNGYQAERINTMGRPIDNTEVVTDCIGRQRRIGSITYIPTTGQRGSADISATLPDENGRGTSVKIEVKMKDRQSEYQKEYERSILRSGGEYWLVRSFDEFYDRYQEFINRRKA